MTAINAGIIGMGHAYPSGILTNADLEKIVDTSDEWITSRTGIKQRHKAAENEYTSQFGTAAARQAIERAHLQPTDIDIILCATTTPDQIMPSTGALIQAQWVQRMLLVWTCSLHVRDFFTDLPWSNR